MSLFGRYLQHPTVATTGRTAVVDAGQPLDAGRMVWLANNAVHLAEQNPLRALRQHPGANAFYAPAEPGPSFTATPTTADIRWAVSPKDGAAAIDLGVHYVWQLPSGPLPKVRVSFSTKVEGGYTLGWVFAIAPGTSGPTWATLQTGGTTTSGSWDDQSEELTLTAAELGAVDFTPTNGVDEASTAEGGGLRCFRAFLAAYNSSNTNAPGSLAWLRGIALHIEEP